MKTLSGLFVLTLICLTVAAQAEDAIFSGPQIGEKLPPLKVKGVIGEQAAKEYDLIQSAGNSPILIVFFHKRTRPAFGLTNTLMKYAASRKKDGLKSGVVFLTSDSTETEKWMGNVARHFQKGIEYGISPDGQEGPGAYGLNRNVTLTILIGQKDQVTANFALVQPSIQVDGPKILKAVVAAIGSGEVPDLRTLEGERYRGQRDPRMKPPEDAKLGGLLRSVINKQATPEQIEEAARKVEEYVKDNKQAQQHLSRVTNTVVNSDRFQTYGTKTSRTYLKKWSKDFPVLSSPVAKPEKNTDEAN